jgi:hypothetical protein
MLTKIRDFIFNFIGVGLLLTSIIYVILFDQLTPRKLFSLPLLILVPVSLIVITCILSWLLLRYKSHSKEQPKKQKQSWDKKQTIKLLKFGIPVLIVFGIVILIYNYVYNSTYNKQLALAKNDFTLKSVGSIPQNQIESTLVDLEQGMISARKMYQVNTDEKPILFLFPNVTAMLAYTGQSAGVAGSVEILNGQIIVDLPVEAARNSMQSAEIDSTPKHESVHIVMAEILGENLYNLPKWFLEGTAQYQQYIEAYPDQIMLKYALWRNLVPTMPGQILLSYDISLANYHTDSFYVTSYELTEYLVQNYGNNSLVKLFKLYSDSLNFDSAFEQVYGMNQEAMYQKWVQAYF